MSTDILATIKRDGTTLYTNIPIQLDFAGDLEITTGYSEPPHYRYDGFIQQILDIRQHDLIMDQLNTDPRTSTNVEYQVVSKPEKFPVTGNMQFKADDAQITGFS